MRISKTLLLACVCCSLSACDGGFGGVSRAAPERVQLADGLIVAGADGWCVDRASTRTREARAVVVLGSCASIAGDAAARSPGVDGVVTVSVEADGAAPPSLDDLESFFGTEAGRAALARDGQADSVDILELRRSDELLLVHAADESVATGLAPDVWRALFALQGRFVSVSFFGVSDEPIGPVLGRTTLMEQVASMRAAN